MMPPPCFKMAKCLAATICTIPQLALGPPPAHLLLAEAHRLCCSQMETFGLLPTYKAAASITPPPTNGPTSLRPPCTTRSQNCESAGALLEHWQGFSRGRCYLR